MAGLGNNVGTEFTMWSLMGGNQVIGGEPVNTWFFDRDFSGSGFMGDRTLPSAHVEYIEGELCQLHFANWSPMPHTIHLHGMDVDQANDGVPQTSAPVAPGESFTYQFVAPHAGTYHYHCHVDTIVHYHRGMGGAVIVRPPDGSTSRGWDGGPVFNEEVLWHLNTFDMSWKDISASGPATARHRPDVFMINGRETADALIDPYTVIDLAPGQVVYLRLLNDCYQSARVALGGLPFEVVASDGRPMRQVPTVDSWTIAPGERYDLLLTAGDPTVVDATVDYLDDYTGNVSGQAATRISIQ